MAITAWFKQHRRRLSEKITLYQQSWKAFTGLNVKNYQVYFASPGDHGTGAGRVREEKTGQNETGPEVGLLVRDEFEKQLAE